MKQFFTILFAVFSFMQITSAQVLYSNDFEDGTLGDMIAIDNDFKTPHANVANYGNSFNVLQLQNGGYICGATSWFDPAGKADNWLITPQVEITDANTIMKWLSRAPDASYRDGYRVLASTTGNAIGDFTDVLMEIANEETSGLTARNISLADYVGQSIYLAFHHNANDQDVLWFDDIIVKVRENNDVSVKGLEFGDKICLPTTTSASFSFLNEGILDVTSVVVSWDLNGTTGSETFDGLSVAPGESMDLTLTNDFVFELGSGQTFIMGITAVNGVEDANTADNGTGRNFNVNPEFLDFGGVDTHGDQLTILGEIEKGKSVVIDFFASWCGPCESSTPELNTVYVANKDVMTVIGITIEPTDTEAIVNGLGWGATYPKFAFEAENRNVWSHYSSCLEIKDAEGELIGGGIPTFVMLCPKEGGGAEVSLGSTGFGSGMFNAYGAKAQECNNVTGVDNVLLINDITMSPSPVIDMMKLEFYMDETIANLSANVVNSLGQVVSTLTFDANIGLHTKNIDMSEFNSGMYYIQFSKGNKVKSQKFIKL